MKNYLKTITILCVSAVLLTSCNETKQEEVKETVEVKTDVSAEKAAVTEVMKSYKDAIQNLTTEGTMELFTKEATIFESGGSEGTYEQYESHHLGPELVHFNSFIFSDYTIDVVIDMPFAFVNETYIYTIDIKVDEGAEPRIIKKKGVATSDLKKNRWKMDDYQNTFIF